jgi:RNA-directed DNA polymerase
LSLSSLSHECGSVGVDSETFERIDTYGLEPWLETLWEELSSGKYAPKPQQHGFRPGLDAKMALRRVYWHVTQHGRREVVDADLRDYLDTASYCPPGS